MKTSLILLLFISAASSVKKPKQHVTCTRDYTKIGCYDDKRKALPIQLITDRDMRSPHSQGYLIDWNNWWGYIHSLTCRCAEKAKSLNYTIFGLQNYGECWSGPGAEKDFFRESTSTTCYPHPCDVKRPEKECVGMQNTNFIYRIKYDPCKSSPCKNGGTCSTGPHGFFCHCLPNYQGSVCERDDPCKSSPCKNGGTCSTAPHGFFCRCPPNYEGSVCENDVNECLRNPCQNKAVCKNTHGGFKCACLRGFKGQLCEISCSQPFVDLCILVDSSGSIGNNNYAAIKRFLFYFVNKLDISTTKTHVAIVYYNDHPTIHGKLNDRKLHVPILLKLSILRLPFLDGDTRTDLALKTADKQIFSPGGGDRRSVPNVIVVITDGKHSPGSGPIKDVVKPLKDRGVRIIALGVDRSADLKGLQEIALGNRKNVFVEDNIEQISTDNVLKAIKKSC